MGHRRLAALTAVLLVAAEAQADEASDARLGETLVITATPTETAPSRSPTRITVIRRERRQDATLEKFAVPRAEGP